LWSLPALLELPLVFLPLVTVVSACDLPRARTLTLLGAHVTINLVPLSTLGAQRCWLGIPNSNLSPRDETAVIAQSALTSLKKAPKAVEGSAAAHSKTEPPSFSDTPLGRVLTRIFYIFASLQLAICLLTVRPPSWNRTTAPRSLRIWSIAPGGSPCC
jgi:hypothetical protein